MNVFISLLSVSVLVVFVILERLKYKRLYHIEKLRRNYDDLEMYFIRHNVELNNKNIELLKMYKNIAVNPSFLDVQVLIMSKFVIEKSMGKIVNEDKKRMNEAIKDLGVEFKTISDQFDNHANSLIKLSVYKPDFIWFVFKIVSNLAIKKRINKVRSFKKTFTYVQDNENVIAYKALSGC